MDILRMHLPPHFGARGANGVVIVLPKRHSGKPRVNYDGDVALKISPYTKDDELRNFINLLIRTGLQPADRHCFHHAETEKIDAVNHRLG